MATTSGAGFTTSDTNFDLTRGSSQLLKMTMVDDGFIAALKDYGVLNVVSDVSQTAGSTKRLFNDFRRESAGVTGDADRYSNAGYDNFGHRDVAMNMISDTIKWKTDGTFSQQITEFNQGLGKKDKQSRWITNVMKSSIINQAAGNTATSITRPDIDRVTFTGASELLKVTGFNTAIAPSSAYKAYGSLATGSVTTDQGVTSSNVLSVNDLYAAVETITGMTAGVPAWNLIDGRDVLGLCVVSWSGANQLLKEVDTAGGMTVSKSILSTMNGGKKYNGLNDFMIPGIPLAFIVLPDYLMPRGVHSSTSAEVANTRRAVILGANAVDLVLGKGYRSEGGQQIPGFSVSVDTTYKPLNREVFCTAEGIYGIKKAQILGTGSLASTAYDLASYVITHYTRA